MKGFTLIELMIVVAIIAILAAIAYPAYQNQVQRSHRATAQGEMLAYAQAMERCFTTTNTYIGCTYSPDVDPARYEVEPDNVSATEFRIVATPRGAQTSDRCGTMTLRQNGNTTPDTNGCWD